MAHKRVKKRTQPKPGNASTAAARPNQSASQSPKSMVIRKGGAGEVGPSVSQLVEDVRSMMEPDTASRLKVSNCLLRTPMIPRLTF